MRIPRWAAHLIPAIISAIVAYYTAQISQEHRMTKLEEDVFNHSQSDALDRADFNQKVRNIWYAIQKNNGEVPVP